MEFIYLCIGCFIGGLCTFYVHYKRLHEGNAQRHQTDQIDGVRDKPEGVMFSVSYKADIVMDDLRYLTPDCYVLFSSFIDWCWNKDLPIVITSLMSDRDGVKTVSNTHATGRAFDVRFSAPWTKDDAEDCMRYHNRLFKNIAAISSRTGEPIACDLHGDPKHFHFQTRS